MEEETMLIFVERIYERWQVDLSVNLPDVMIQIVRRTPTYNDKQLRVQRTRRVLIIIILCTIPCYCLGIVTLRILSNQRVQRTLTPTSTLTLTLTETSSPTTTATLNPSATSTPTYTPTATKTATPLPTDTSQPTLTSTPIPPTDTTVPSDTPTVEIIPTETATLEITP
jgi:hypothetical protein